MISVISPTGSDDSDASKIPVGTVVIRFAEPDTDNPFDWRPAKKWQVTSPS
jgi:hypothetical protein